MQSERQNIWYAISLVALFALFAFRLGKHVNDFYVPESDFFDFRAKAVSLRNFEWPDSFKRPPLYPAAIAAVSAFIPGKDRELYAAELIGVLAALASLFLFYKIAAHFWGRNAVLLAWLWALHPSTLRMAIKPKSEILVTVLILWALYLFLKEKKWAYAVAFAASCVRYEGALIIAAIGAADFFTHRDKLKTIVWSLLAGAFIVIWTALQSGGGDGESYFSYFNDYKPNFAFLRSFWEAMIGFLPDALHKYNVLLFALVMMLGYIYGFQKQRRSIIALGVFFVGFLAMHIAWPMPNFDYQVLIVWNALLAFGFGIAWVAGQKRFVSRVAALINNKIVIILAALALFAVVIFLTNRASPFPQYHVSPWEWLVAAIPAVLALVAFWGSEYRIKLAPFLLAMLLLLPVLFAMLSDANALFYSIRYSKAEFRLVGEWFRENAEKGDKLVVEQPAIVAYYAELSDEHFVHLVDVPRTTPDSLYAWCGENGVTHVAWLSANRIFETDNAWYQWKMNNRGWSTISFLEKGIDSHGFVLLKRIKIGPRLALVYKI